MKDITKDDLKFVPLEDMIDEIGLRAENFVMAYETRKEDDSIVKGKSGELILMTRWSKVKSYATMLGLCECVKRDIMLEAEHPKQGGQ